MTYLKKYISGTNIASTINRTKIQNIGATIQGDSAFANKQTMPGIISSSYISLPNRITATDTSVTASDYTLICEGSAATVTMPSNINLKGQIVNIVVNKGTTVQTTAYSATYNRVQPNTSSNGATVYFQYERTNPVASSKSFNNSNITITNNSLTDPSAPFTTDYTGHILIVGDSYAIVTSRTSTTLNFTGGWIGPTPSNGLPYQLHYIVSKIPSTITGGGVTGTNIPLNTSLNSKYFYLGISNSNVTLRPDGNKVFTVPTAQATLTNGQYINATAYVSTPNNPYVSIGSIEGSVTVSGNNITVSPKRVIMPIEFDGTSSAIASTSLSEYTNANDILVNQYAQTHMVRAGSAMGVITSNTASENVGSTTNTNASRFTLSAGWVDSTGSATTTPSPSSGTAYEINSISQLKVSGTTSTIGSTSLISNSDRYDGIANFSYTGGTTTAVSSGAGLTITDASAIMNGSFGLNDVYSNGTTVTYSMQINNLLDTKEVRVGQSITVTGVTSSPANVFNLTGTVVSINGGQVSINSTATGTVSSVTNAILKVNDRLAGFVAQTQTSAGAIITGTITANSDTAITVSGWTGSAAPGVGKPYSILTIISASDNNSITDLNNPPIGDNIDQYNGYQINTTSSLGATSGRIVGYNNINKKWIVASWSNGTPLVNSTYSIGWNTSYPAVSGQWAGCLVKAGGVANAGLTMTSRTSVSPFSITDTTDTTTATITGVTASGGSIRYATSGGHTFLEGDIVTITGVNPTAYNLSNVTIVRVDSDGLWFRINNAATGTYVSGGTATMNPFIAGAYAGYKVRAIGTGSQYTYSTISSNTSTGLTLTGAWTNGTPAIGSTFDIISDYSYATITSNTENQLNFSAWTGETPPSINNSYQILTTPSNSGYTNWIITADNITLSQSPSSTLGTSANLNLGGITVVRSGTDTIDGATSLNIDPKTSKTFQNNGSGWVTI